MRTDFNPRRLDVAGLARSGAELAATTSLENLDRLLLECAPSVAPGSLEAVTWCARAEYRPVLGGVDRLWLHLSATHRLPQQCQRCLLVVQTPLSVDRWFRFVADEATAAQEDELSDEDVLVLAPDFDLLALLEDELLMALPLVPKHDVCPVEVKTEVVDGDFQVAQTDKPHPFAALAVLKTHKG